MFGEILDHTGPCFALRLSRRRQSSMTAPAYRLLGQLVAAGLDPRQIEDLVDQVEQMLAAIVDVLRIGFVGRVLDRPEYFGAHHLGKAQDRIQRRAQFMAHIGQEFRFRQIGGLGAAPRFVGDGFRPAPVRRPARPSRRGIPAWRAPSLQTTGEEDQIDMDADRNRRHRPVEGMAGQRKRRPAPRSSGWCQHRE